MTTTASERLRGNSGLFLTLKIKGGSTTFAADKDVKKAEITNEDKDDNDLTFAEAASGASKTETLAVTAIQSTAATSLWRFLYDNPGATFEAVYGPHGNAIPTAAKPHFKFDCTANGRPTIGGEARKTKDGNEFEYAMVLDTPTTLVTGP